MGNIPITKQCCSRDPTDRKNKDKRRPAPGEVLPQTGETADSKSHDTRGQSRSQANGKRYVTGTGSQQHEQGQGHKKQSQWQGNKVNRKKEGLSRRRQREGKTNGSTLAPTDQNQRGGGDDGDYTHTQNNDSSTNGVHDPTKVSSDVMQLCEAAKEGDVPIVRMLLSKGINPNALDERGDPSLLTASANGRLEVVRLLLQHKASVNLHNVADGVAPLHYAAAQNHIDVATLLLHCGADINATAAIKKETPLHYACLLGNLEMARLLIHAGADVNAVNERDQVATLSAIRAASVFGHTEMVHLLVSAGAALDGLDENDESVLHLAARFDRPETVEPLLTAGAKSDIKFESLFWLSEIEIAQAQAQSRAESARSMKKEREREREREKRKKMKARSKRKKDNNNNDTNQDNTHLNDDSEENDRVEGNARLGLNTAITAPPPTAATTKAISNTSFDSDDDEDDDHPPFVMPPEYDELSKLYSERYSSAVCEAIRLGKSRRAEVETYYQQRAQAAKHQPYLPVPHPHPHPHPHPPPAVSDRTNEVGSINAPNGANGGTLVSTDYSHLTMASGSSKIDRSESFSNSRNYNNSIMASHDANPGVGPSSPDSSAHPPLHPQQQQAQLPASFQEPHTPFNRHATALPQDSSSSSLNASVGVGAGVDNADVLSVLSVSSYQQQHSFTQQHEQVNQVLNQHQHQNQLYQQAHSLTSLPRALDSPPNPHYTQHTQPHDYYDLPPHPSELTDHQAHYQQQQPTAHTIVDEYIHGYDDDDYDDYGHNYGIEDHHTAHPDASAYPQQHDDIFDHGHEHAITHTMPYPAPSSPIQYVASPGPSAGSVARPPLPHPHQHRAVSVSPKKKKKRNKKK